MSHPSGSAAGSPAWKYTICTEEEAMSVLLEAVSRAGTLQQTQVKPLMRSLDSRFAGKAQANGTVGMISHLIARAEREGLITVDRGLDEAGRLVDQRRLSNPLIQGTMRLIQASPATTTVAAPAEKTVAAQPPGSKPVREHDSRVYAAAIQKSRCGPFSDVRPRLYEALLEVVMNEAPAPLGELIALAADRVRAAEREGPESEQASASDPRVSSTLWPAIEDAFANLVVSAGAVLDEERVPIRPGWGVKRKVIYGVAPSTDQDAPLAVRCDAHLVRLVLEDQGALRERDLPNLARAMFHSSARDAISAVEDAVDFMLREDVAWARVEHQDGSAVLMATA
jgi:hypothetical protein